MWKNINEWLKARMEKKTITVGDLDFDRISYRLRLPVASVIRLIAAPFFILSLAIIFVAIVPGVIAEWLNKLSSKVMK